MDSMSQCLAQRRTTWGLTRNEAMCAFGSVDQFALQTDRSLAPPSAGLLFVNSNSARTWPRVSTSRSVAVSMQGA